jgi:hypothetical protein
MKGYNSPLFLLFLRLLELLITFLASRNIDSGVVVIVVVVLKVVLETIVAISCDMHLPKRKSRRNGCDVVDKLKFWIVQFSERELM